MISSEVEQKWRRDIRVTKEEEIIILWRTLGFCSFFVQQGRQGVGINNNSNFLGPTDRGLSVGSMHCYSQLWKFSGWQAETGLGTKLVRLGVWLADHWHASLLPGRAMRVLRRAHGVPATFRPMEPKFLRPCTATQKAKCSLIAFSLLAEVFNLHKEITVALTCSLLSIREFLSFNIHAHALLSLNTSQQIPPLYVIL